MIAFCCHFYKWTPDQCLDMQAKLFFAMNKEAKKMEVRQFAELADISLIPKMQLDYYFNLKDKYAAMLDPAVLQLPNRPSGPVFEAGAPETMDVLKGVANAMKRSHGYGR